MVFLRRGRLLITSLLIKRVKYPNMETRHTKVIDTFIKKYLGDEEVLAILVTGSFARGIDDKDSDLDLQVVTSSQSRHRKRGNVIIDGVLVEYCINPYHQIRKYFEIDAKHNNPMMSIALLEGKIIFEKYKSASRLKKYAKASLEMGYAMLNKDRVSFYKYVLADTLNKMNSLYRKERDDFSFLFHVNLRLIYETYATFLRLNLLKDPMLKDYFEGNTRFGHIINDFPDKRFASMFLSAMKSNAPREQIVKYRTLTNHVLQKMGGLTLNGWSLRIPIDYSNAMDKRTRVF